MKLLHQIKKVQIVHYNRLHHENSSPYRYHFQFDSRISGEVPPPKSSPSLFHCKVYKIRSPLVFMIYWWIYFMKLDLGEYVILNVLRPYLSKSIYLFTFTFCMFSLVES